MNPRDLRLQDAPTQEYMRAARWRTSTSTRTLVSLSADSAASCRTIFAPVDIELMHEASLLLLGEHDFAAFCKQREGASTIRELKILRTVRGGETIATTFVADAFCHSMVRAVMGGLVAVGQRKITPDDLGEILERKVRDPRVKVMPPGGLVLEEVSYPNSPTSRRMLRIW